MKKVTWFQMLSYIVWLSGTLLNYVSSQLVNFGKFVPMDKPMDNFRIKIETYIRVIIFHFRNRTR